MPDVVIDRFRFLARDTTKAPKAHIVAVADAPAGGIATMRLYDVIDSWGGPYGVSAKEFSAALDQLPADTSEIHLHINSPGGEVWDALAILNSLRQHKAKVVVIVDGIAASAASFIAMAGDEVIMAPNSELMIHLAWGLCVGNADDMTKMASDLNHESDNLASIYAKKAGGTIEEWRAVMAAETWFSAEEAVAAKLADRVLDGDPKTATTAKARFDLSVFAHAGRAHAPAPQTPAASASGPAAPRGTSTERESRMSETLIAGLRERLGFAENADEATILASIDEALSETAEAPANAVVIPDGHVVIPAAKLADLEAGAANGNAAAARLAQQERDAFLDSVRTKYAPANRAAWEKEYERDPEGTKAHFAAAPALVPVTAIGTDAEPDDLSDEAIYNALYGADKKVS